EAAFGAEYLRDVRSRLGVPFVSANLRDARGEPLAPGRIDVEAGGGRVALGGGVSPSPVRGGPAPEDPPASVLKATQGRAFDSLVVLAYLPETELRRLATEMPEADLVVGGPTGQAIAPTKAGPTWLASATNKGKFLIQMDHLGRDERWSGRVVE